MLDTVLEILFGDRRPTALTGELIADFLEMWKEVAASLFIGFSEISRRVHADVVCRLPSLLRSLL